MEDCEESPFPFLSSIKLLEGGFTPLVDNILFRKVIGSLLYLPHLRPDISYVVSDAARYMQEPHELHWKETTRILHYLHGTREFGIDYSASAKLDIFGFTDSEWDGDNTYKKSTLGFLFMVESGPVF